MDGSSLDNPHLGERAVLRRSERIHALMDILHTRDVRIGNENAFGAQCGDLFVNAQLARIANGLRGHINTMNTVARFVVMTGRRSNGIRILRRFFDTGSPMTGMTSLMYQTLIVFRYIRRMRTGKIIT